MPRFVSLSTVSLILLTVSAAGPTAAQTATNLPQTAPGNGVTYHLVQPTYGCQDPRATRALTDPATARLTDPDWLHFFTSEGNCTRISPNSNWDMLSASGDMALMQEHGHASAAPLFFRSSLLSAAQDSTPAADAASDPNASSGDSVATAVPSPADPVGAFAEAQADRKTWDGWLAGLTGDFRAGAEAWARQWGSPGRASCDVAPASQDWHDGCLAARLRSLASDTRRQAEPYYAQGWNAPAGSAPPSQPALAASPKDQAERKTAAFRAGQADRKKWDSWFSGFLGDYRAGAAYWFAQRTARPRGNCANMTLTQTWRDGCEMARRKLAEYDARLETDPIYAKGWDATTADNTAPKPPSGPSLTDKS